MGRVAAPGSRTQPSPWPGPQLLAWEWPCLGRLTAALLSVHAAEEQFILSQVALLEQVDALVPMLDSTHIKGTFWGCISSALHGEVGGWAGLPWAQTGSAPCLYPHLRVLATCTGIKIARAESSASELGQFGPKDTQVSPVTSHSRIPSVFYPTPQHLSFRVLQGPGFTVRVPAGGGGV